MNERYEYTTRELNGTPASISASADREMNARGWRRVWADVTVEGVFAVYRRERASDADTDVEGLKTNVVGAADVLRALEQIEACDDEACPVCHATSDALDASIRGK